MGLGVRAGAGVGVGVRFGVWAGARARARVRVRATEVGELEESLAVEQQVLGLDIAVDEALRGRE